MILWRRVFFSVVPTGLNFCLDRLIPGTDVPGYYLFSLMGEDRLSDWPIFEFQISIFVLSSEYKYIFSEIFAIEKEF